MPARRPVPLLLLAALALPALLLRHAFPARADDAAERRALVQKLLAAKDEAERDALLRQNPKLLTADLALDLCRAAYDLQGRGAPEPQVRRVLALAQAVATRSGAPKAQAHVFCFTGVI